MRRLPPDSSREALTMTTTTTTTTEGLRMRDAHLRELLDGREFGNETHPPHPPFVSAPPAPQQSSYFSRSFNSNVVVVMAVLLFALVVAAFINTVARCFLRARRPRQGADHSNLDKGLDKSVIEALPVVSYGAQPLKSSLDPAGGSECVVCLSEFTAGEKLRLLPDCQHAFHLGCIDTWLLTHTTCPVCRRSVLPAESPPRSDSSGDDDPACVAGGSARFGSARIASVVDIEIEPSSGTPPPPGSSGNSNPGSSSSNPGSVSRNRGLASSNSGLASSSTRPRWPFGSAEAAAIIMGSRRFGATTQSRSQGLV